MTKKSNKDNVFSEQVRILHSNLIVSIPANLICATAVCVGLFHGTSQELVLKWFGAVILISIFRLAGYYYYRQTQTNKRNLIIFIIGMAISAALWGALDSVFMPTDNLAHQMIIIVIIAGITAGGVQTLNANLISCFIYVSLIVAPLCAWLFLQSGLTYMVLGVTMTAYLFYMLATSIRAYKILELALTLRFEKIDLIENLSASNKKLFESYKALEKHEHEITYINKLNDLLQTCKQLSEAYDIILYTAKEIFSEFSGGIVILNTSTNTLETVKQWGKHQLLPPQFTDSDCWALRKGKNYYINDSTIDVNCNHFNTLPASYICLPLIISQNGVIGLLLLHSQQKNAFNQHQEQLAISLSEGIQLSLANIKLRETLYEQSIRDPLTGLFNRRYLAQTLPRELNRAVRDKKTVCVAMLDLDYFKEFNDANGHEAGDELLKFIGKLLSENFRASDIACRFGGEEFLLVLVNSDLANACLRLERIREELKNGKIFFNGCLLPSISVSIGVAAAPMQGVSEKDIINAADQALYLAKSSGRDMVKTINQTIFVPKDID